MYNKKVLSTAKKELNKAKAPKKPKDIITDPRGQWNHPGLNTRIPGNGSKDINITMNGVYKPLIAIADTGEKRKLHPGENHTFRGAKYVDEFPIAKKGGERKRRKTKSLSGTNKLMLPNPLLRNYKNRVYDPNVDYFQDGGVSVGLNSFVDRDEEGNTIPMLIPSVNYSKGNFNTDVSTNIPTERPGDYEKNINLGLGYYKPLGKRGKYGNLGIQGDASISNDPYYNVGLEYTTPYDKKLGLNFKASTSSLKDLKNNLNTSVGLIYRFQKGGAINLELTQDEIDQYVKGGYIVEDISVPELTRAQTGGIKTHKSEDGTITNTITKPNGDVVIQVKTKDGKYYEKVKHGLPQFVKDEFKKRADWENRSSGMAQPVDDFWTLPMGMTSAGVKGAVGLAKGLTSLGRNAVKSSLVQSGKAGLKKSLVKSLPGSSINNLVASGFAGTALTDILTGKVAEPWKKANKSGEFSDYADAVTENMFTALDAYPLYNATGKGLKQLGKYATTQTPLKNAYKALHQASANKNKIPGLPRVVSFVNGLNYGIDDIIKGRKFSETFPITKKQKAKIEYLQDQAHKEGLEFMDDYLYRIYDGVPYYGEIHPDVRSKIDKITDLEDPTLDGFKRKFDNTHYLIGPYGNAQHRLVNINEKQLAEALANGTLDDRTVDYIRKNKHRVSGVNWHPQSVTFRNQGLYYQKPEKIRNVTVHEAGHSMQELGYGSNTIRNSLSILDPKYPYYIANENTKFGKEFRNAQVFPKENQYLWEANPLEVHSEVMSAKDKIYREFVKKGMSKMDALRYLRNPDNALADEIIKEGSLNSFFKHGTTNDQKRKLIKMLPAIIPAGAAVNYMPKPQKSKEMKKGGIVADLTHAEIQDYIAQGYIIEELDEPELDQAQKGKSVNNTTSSKFTTYTAKNDKDYAFRKKAYDDSLALHKLNLEYENLAVKGNHMLTNKRGSFDPIAYKNLENKLQYYDALQEKVIKNSNVPHKLVPNTGKLISKISGEKSASHPRPKQMIIKPVEAADIIKKPKPEFKPKPKKIDVVTAPVKVSTKDTVIPTVTAVQSKYPVGYQPYSLYGKVLDPEVYGYGESIENKPLQLGQYADALGKELRMKEYKKANKYPWVKQEGGESAPVKELDEVTITPVSMYQQEYKDANSYDDFYNQKVDEYLRNMPKGLGKMMGIDSDRVPDNLIKKINDEYQYNMNNYVTDQVLKNKKYDVDAREEWVDKLKPSEYEAFANSKYTGKLKPNLWTRTRAGVRALGNTLLPGQPISYDIKGLTPKEQKAYKDDSFAAFDALAATDLPGAWIGNYLTDSRDYVDRPDLLSGELHANLAEGAESLLNPLGYIEGVGVYDVSKAGIKALKNSKKLKKLAEVSAPKINTIKNKLTDNAKLVKESFTPGILKKYGDLMTEQVIKKNKLGNEYFKIEDNINNIQYEIRKVRDKLRYLPTNSEAIDTASDEFIKLNKRLKELAGAKTLIKLENDKLIQKIEFNPYEKLGTMKLTADSNSQTIDYLFDFETGEKVPFDIKTPSEKIIVELENGKPVEKRITLQDFDMGEQYVKTNEKNIEFVKNILPGAKPFGSSTFTKLGVAHASNDIDVAMTASDWEKVKNSVKINLNKQAKYGPTINLGDEFGDQGNIDINIIQENPKTGLAEGDFAREIYKQFFPEEFYNESRNVINKVVLKPSLKKSIPDIKINKTAKELIDAYDPEIKSIIDAYESPKDKQINRIDYILETAKDYDKVKKAQELFAKSIAGKKASIGYQFPEKELDNFVENLSLLLDLGLTDTKHNFVKIASDPKRMQLFLNDFYINKSIYTRQISLDPEFIKTPEDVTKAYKEWIGKGGNAMGLGSNSVELGDPLFLSNDTSITGQIFYDLIKNKTYNSPKEYVKDIINQTSGKRELDAFEVHKIKQLAKKYNFEINENFIPKKLGDLLDLEVYSSFNEAAVKKSNSFTFDEADIKNLNQFYKELGKEIGAKVIQRASYGNSLYATLLNDFDKEYDDLVVAFNKHLPSGGLKSRTQRFTNFSRVVDYQNKDFDLINNYYKLKGYLEGGYETLLKKEEQFGKFYNQLENILLEKAKKIYNKKNSGYYKSLEDKQKEIHKEIDLLKEQIDAIGERRVKINKLRPALFTGLTVAGLSGAAYVLSKKRKKDMLNQYSLGLQLLNEKEKKLGKLPQMDSIRKEMLERYLKDLKYKDGGIVADLTEKEIDEYIAKGYIVEDVD